MKKYITAFFVTVVSVILMKHGIYAANLSEDTSYDVNYIYEGGSVAAEFDAVNITDAAQNAFVALGVYNASGNLEGVSFKKIKVDANSTCKLTSDSVKTPGDGENMKLFAWDEALRPLETGSDFRTVRKNAFINEITVNGKKAIADNSINVITVNSSADLSDISVTDISLPEGASFSLENNVLTVTSEDGKTTANYSFRTAPLTLLDFESDTAEQKPSGWSTGGNKDSSVKVSTTGGGKVMKIADNSTEPSKASAIYQLPAAIEPPYTVCYKIKYERPPFESGIYDVSSCWFHLRNSANSTVMSACVTDNGSYLDYKAKSANGEKSAGGKMRVGVWHEIKMTCVSETEANFYLDGKLIYTAPPLNFVNLEKLSIFTTDSRKCTMYIDDIAIYHDAYAEELKAAYEDIESQFSGVPGWIADLYEPHTGGFYTTLSGKNGAGYVPSLESTAFVYAMLGSSETGLVSTMPDEFKASLIEYFQNAQSDEDGFFYDYGVPRSSYGDRAKMRVYQQCVSKLSALGAEPLYALPSERLAQTASLMAQTDSITLPEGFPSYLATVDGFMGTVKSRNWDTSSWTAGDLTYEDTSYLVQLGEDVYAPYIEALFEWLRTRQDSETGYWAQSGSTNFNALSGAFKVVRIYDRFKTQPPNCDKICKSIIETLFSGEAPTSACDIRNFLDILSIIQKYDADVVKNTLKGKELQIVNVYADYMKLFFKPDGGASNYQNASTATFGGIPAGAGKAEGDIDGTQQMFIARNYLHKLFGRKLDNSKFTSQSEDFWQQIMSKKPRSIMINFETYKTGVTPKSVNSSLWSLSDNESDRTTLIAENDSGKFVCLTDNSETEKANCKTQNILACTSPFKMSFDVCYELPEGVSKRDSVNDFSYSPFYVRSGGSLSLCGVQPVYKNGSFWFYYLENGAANTQSSTQIIPGEWYNVEMSYYFDTTDDKFYTDYTFTDSSGNSDIYSKIPSGALAAKATTYYFSTSTGRKCRVSFDNLHIEEVSK